MINRLTVMQWLLQHLPKPPMAEKLQAPHLAAGNSAEQRASEYLIQQGLQPVARNYRCRYGELDLIMRDQNTLVIVEVRYRRSNHYGSALESITPRKQSRIIAATQCYLAEYPCNTPIRFDAVAISGNQHLEWIPNAFEA